MIYCVYVRTYVRMSGGMCAGVDIGSLRCLAATHTFLTCTCSGWVCKIVLAVTGVLVL